MKTFSKLIHWCLDLLFPKNCLGCGQEGSYLCNDCTAILQPLKSASCLFCGQRSPDGRACANCRRQKHSTLNGVLVAADWNNLLLRQIIYEYKYRFVKELADPLSKLMIDFLKTSQLINYQTEKLVLVPVPLHGRRLAWRGFNQSKLLTEKIGEYFKIPVADKILTRSRYTLPQREINDQNKRAANIKNAFALNKKINSADDNFVKNNVVILVDDIATTGSTLEDCARTLSPLGPKEIWGIVIARG